MILDDIADYIEQNSTGSIGSNIFIGEFPIKQSDAVMLVAMPSLEPDQVFDVYEQVIEFWSRSESSITAYRLLQGVQDIIHRRGNYQTANYHVYFSHSLGSINDGGRDAERRKIYSLLMRVIYRPLTS